jgi:streptomycin 6-kinase
MTPPGSRRWDDGTVDVEGRLGACLGRWGLRADGRLEGGFGSEVFGCIAAGGQEVVVKLTATPDDARAEAAALTRWAHTGAAVRLLAVDLEHGALLLPRVRPGTHLPGGGDLAAVEVAATVLSQLHRAPAAAFPFPTLGEIYRRFGRRAREDAAYEQRASGDPARGAAGLQRLDAARAAALRLCATAGRAVLLHGDFLDKNLIHNGAGYVAIDPIPCIGDACSDVGFFAAGHPAPATPATRPRHRHPDRPGPAPRAAVGSHLDHPPGLPGLAARSTRARRPAVNRRLRPADQPVTPAASRRAVSGRRGGRITVHGSLRAPRRSCFGAIRPAAATTPARHGRRVTAELRQVANRAERRIRTRLVMWPGPWLPAQNARFCGGAEPRRLVRWFASDTILAATATVMPGSSCAAVSDSMTNQPGCRMVPRIGCVAAGGRWMNTPAGRRRPDEYVQMWRDAQILLRNEGRMAALQARLRTCGSVGSRVRTSGASALAVRR